MAGLDWDAALADSAAAEVTTSRGLIRLFVGCAKENYVEAILALDDSLTR